MADQSFSAALTAPAPPGVPPMPKPRLADDLAAFFGAAPDLVGGYTKGLEGGSQYRLRSAQTESALAEADKRRSETLRQTQINNLIIKAQSDPNFAPTVSDLLTISTGAGDFGQGRLHQQELGLRGTLADPNADPAAAFAAGQGVQGHVLPRLYAVGGETVNMTADPNATFQTPAQQAQVRADVALAGMRDRSPATGSVAGGPLIRSSPIGPVQSTDGGVTWQPVLQNTDVAGFNAARAAGAATGQKQAALYANLNNIDTFTGDVDALLSHPGFQEIYGLSSVTDPRNILRGTDAQGAKALRDKLNSRSFLVSIQSMRGMGQLSNQEGAKVETALTAALKPGLGDEEAVLRLGELKAAIANLRRVAEQEAGAAENSLTPPTGAPRSFATEAEAVAAGVRPGERVIIGGVSGTWE